MTILGVPDDLVAGVEHMTIDDYRRWYYDVWLPYVGEREALEAPPDELGRRVWSVAHE